ncbi:MAG: DUF1343 domain-containing protein [Saprospiraceae bacterium]|nr:DUF1343 domain-containing protein [Saprospiraceae bacterium]MDP4999283.1 DUF1343 domain-containing protein [Saprospiraceae bacterium]
MVEKEPLQVAASRTAVYFPELQGKRLGLMVNHTSIVNGVHLVDTLLASGMLVDVVFAPEHGFRGDADAGAVIGDGVDDKTGVRLLSLYGGKYKPDPEDLASLDLVIFDIQDVGARFYTYVSSMTYLMEACAEQGIPFMVLDRPNPIGYYVDGPVLDTAYRSFVGMHPIPVVHGLTVGELATMINGEGWLKGGVQADLRVVSCAGYDHQTYYDLPVPPSPNLPNMKAIYLYPSTCFFEGTVASEGRGTDKQFQVYGHPDFPGGDVSFTPMPMKGAQKPKLEGQLCKGFDLSALSIDTLRNIRQVQVEYLIDFYQGFPSKDSLFLKNLYLDKLAGGKELREAILAGNNAAQIRASWEPELSAYRALRKKYLLYPE